MVSVIAQALLIREAMTTLGGSEIAWGALLFLWLIGAAVGARLGSRSRKKRLWLARLGTPTIAISAVVGVAMLRAIPTVSGAGPGETALPGQVLLVWLIALMPPSISVGWTFSVAGALVGRAHTAYGLECLGAAFGGLVFTFLFARWGTPVISGGLLGIGLAVGLGMRHLYLGTLLFVLGPTLGNYSSEVIAAATWRLGLHSENLERATETRYQRLEVSEGGSRSVFSDGRWVGSLPPDPYLVLPSSQLLPLIHPDPRRLAVIGGLTNGMVAGLLAPPVEHLTLIEEDRGLVGLLNSDLSPTLESVLSDPRVTVITADHMRAMSGLAQVDMILLLDGPPATLKGNRSRTLEFFELCSSRLAPGGLIVIDSGVDSTYVGGHSGRLLAIQAATLRQVFPRQTAIAGTKVLLVAGFEDSELAITSSVLINRWRLRGSPGIPYLDRLIPTLVDTARSLELTRLVNAAEAPINTVSKPTAVLPAAVLIEGRGLHLLLPWLNRLQNLPPWIFPASIVVAALGIIAWGWPAKKVRTEPALVIGYASMTWYLLLLTAWQGTRGAVYSEIGALTAIFMAGMVGGTAWSQRWINPSRSLLFLLPGAAGLSLIIGTSLATKQTLITVPILLACGGTVTGAAFAGTAVLAGDKCEPVGIGRAFSADEAGAALAAITVGVIGLPWLGASSMATASAVMCLAGVIGVCKHRATAQ